MAHYISDAEGKLIQIAGKNYKSYMPLGMIFASAVMLEEISVKRLNGQSLSITGTYKDFCNWVISQGANAPTCNISTYASEMTTYGQCGKFVINNTNTAQTSGSYTVPAYSIKLPTITEFIASNNGGKELGLAELDEFKSHQHGVCVQSGNYTVVQNGNGNWCATYSNNYTLATGGSETRPKNIRYPYYIVVAQGVKPLALADMTKKAEKDGSNLTDADVESWQDKCSFERVETVYDKDSTDANINWGYTSGIQSSTIADKNFTKYKKLRIYYCNKNSNIENDSWGRNNIIELDLTKHINFDYSASNQLRYIAYTQNYNGGIIVKINSEKTSFAVVITDENNASNNSFVYKIEGVY